MKYIALLIALFLFSCTPSAKKEKIVAGGTSEETNTVAAVPVLADGKNLSVATAFEIKARFKIDSMPQKSEELHELVAQNKVFNLALLNGACGTKEPVFAFFLENESCEQAVLSNRPVKSGTWTFVEAEWDGRYLTLYQDGVKVAQEEKILASMPFSELPVYLGKFKVEELSLNSEAL